LGERAGRRRRPGFNVGHGCPGVKSDRIVPISRALWVAKMSSFPQTLPLTAPDSAAIGRMRFCATRMMRAASPCAEVCARASCASVMQASCGLCGRHVRCAGCVCELERVMRRAAHVHTPTRAYASVCKRDQAVLWVVSGVTAEVCNIGFRSAANGLPFGYRGRFDLSVG
jgi:hypothetical protein